MPMEYIAPTLNITTLADMVDEEIVNEMLVNLVELEEDQSLQDSINMFRKIEKRPSMIDTLRVKKLRKETLFSSMTTSLHGSQVSFVCIG